MRAKSLITLEDKYNPPLDTWVKEIAPVTNKVTYRKTTLIHYLCKEGDELTVITPNAAYHMVAVVVENKDGVRFTMRWDNLEILDVTFTL